MPEVAVSLLPYPLEADDFAKDTTEDMVFPCRPSDDMAWIGPPTSFICKRPEDACSWTEDFSRHWCRSSIGSHDCDVREINVTLGRGEEEYNAKAG
ncbi:hypothetical protein MRX96_045958 [Rhipicephalus microplus]